jgi:hypothetical protein
MIPWIGEPSKLVPAMIGEELAKCKAQGNVYAKCNRGLRPASNVVEGDGSKPSEEG